jgi:hypothetical protein
MAKLDVKAFGLSLGIIWAACAFILGITAMMFDWGTSIVSLCSSMYIGYKPTFSGSIIGAMWGFVDAGIGGVIVAWMYNKLAK